MNKLLNISPVYIIGGIVVILLYYLALILYERKLKKRDYIKNFNDDYTSVKNFHKLADNFESAPIYNNLNVKPVIITNDNSDWRKTLDEINDLERELHTNNSLDQLLLDNDIDTEK
jgi:hypothetical protein